MKDSNRRKHEYYCQTAELEHTISSLSLGIPIHKMHILETVRRLHYILAQSSHPRVNP